MNLITILAIAFALAMDACAVAIAAGIVLPRLSFRTVFRLSWHFGFFQFMMPVIGFAAGRGVHQWLASIDHWIAFGLLAFIGAKMIYESFGHEPGKNIKDPTRGWNLVILSVATSIDALAVGLTMAFLGIDIWIPAAIIGIVAALMTIIGLLLGRRLGTRFGHAIEFTGGIILIAIGIKILIQHLST